MLIDLDRTICDHTLYLIQRRPDSFELQGSRRHPNTDNVRVSAFIRGLQAKLIPLVRSSQIER